MDCPGCGLTYPADYRFCPTCGIPLTAPSTDVGGGLDAVAPSVDRRVAEPRAPLAERRLVSVLFLDLVGFTTLSESLDPEDVREIQSQYFESARAAVAHYGGSLEKFIGDAVMAVWGTPVAHEDDGERAVRTALEVVSAVETIAPAGGSHLVARAAITTGEAAVTIDAAGQGMVTGDLVNTASRLQSAASPGTVLVDDVTRRVVGRAIEFEPAGDQTLKGKAAAVAAWRAVGVARHPGTESRTGHRGPFVGRDSEVRALLDLLSAVADERRMRVVSLIGIAGIGKSRLVWELENRSGDVASHPRWHVGRAPAYGEGTAFAPLADMVRRSAGIAESDAAELVRRALTETLGRIIPDDGERAWMEPRLLALLQPSTTQEPQREELFAAWRRFFEAHAETSPITLVFEDLQWADPSLLDFIDYLADWSRHRPILVITLARPELLDTRPTWGAGLPHFTAMHLDRLPDGAIDQLLGELAPGLSAEIIASVRRRADGVPLYAVEMARMVIERSPDGDGDAVAMEIPESLHALIAARIDALPATDRSLLLTGAVLGRRFPPEALAALSGTDRPSFGERVRALLRREFLSMDDEPRSPGRGQLSFVQELVREVAYHTLSRRQRRARHLDVVAYLESLEDPDLAEPIAEHLLAALRATGVGQPEDAGITVHALEALRLAAERAQALHSPARALTHLEDALSLTDHPATRAELAEEAGLAARAAARFDRAERHLREAIQLRQELGDAGGAARHRAQLASLLLMAQRSDTALAELESAWDSATVGMDAVVPPELPAELARAHLLRGDRPRAIEWAERAIAAADASGGSGARAVAIDARITLGTAYAEDGAEGNGMDLLRQAIDEAEEAGLGAIQLRALNNLAWVIVADDSRETFKTARKGLELARRLGNREYAIQLLDVASVVAIDTGDWDWALAALEEAFTDEVPTVYQVDFAVMQTIIRAFRGTADPTLPIDQIGALEADLDPAAPASVSLARAVVAMTAGDLSQGLRLAQAAALGTGGFEQFAAFALAGRLAAWSGDLTAASDALAQLEAHPAWGRSAEAARQTLRAAIGSVHASAKGAATAAAEREWSAALRAWRDLDLPLRLGLCHLDRWILAGDADDQQAALKIFEELGAAPLMKLARVGVTGSVSGRSGRPRAAPSPPSIPGGSRSS
jgi:class 3 adenylate cyclase/tetratricopeptide (TPR) repeat protein